MLITAAESDRQRLQSLYANLDTSLPPRISNSVQGLKDSMTHYFSKYVLGTESQTLW